MFGVYKSMSLTSASASEHTPVRVSALMQSQQLVVTGQCLH